MLAPRASSAFVCSRCKLKLAHLRTLRSPRHLSHARFSATTAHRDALNVLDVSENDKSKQDESPDQSKSTLRFNKGKPTIIERTELLRGVKTLGEDAEILVLQKVGAERRKPPSEHPVTIISDASSNTPKVLASLEAEKSVSPEEIQEQIESFCPRTDKDRQEPYYITQSAFMKLTKKLLKSFNANQLSLYYSSAKGIASGKVKKELLETLSPEGSGKNSVDRTAWHPGTTSISRRLPGVWETKYAQGRPASKPLLVDQILRDIWGLVLLEEIESSGEIELTLKPWQLFLLSMGECMFILRKESKLLY